MVWIKNQNEKYNTYLPEFNYSWHLDRDPYSYILQKNTYRAPLNIHSNLEPIYIFGCSFAYGEHLFEKDTFGAQLAKLTNRPVYNFAFPGFGVQHMLFQLENMTMPSSKAPKYIIYVYIHDHLRRLSTQFIQPCQLTRYPLYIEKNNDLIFKKFKSFSPAIFYIYRKIQGFWAKYSAPYKLNLLDKHFIKAYKYMKKCILIQNLLF